MKEYETYFKQMLLDLCDFVLSKQQQQGIEILLLIDANETLLTHQTNDLECFVADVSLIDLHAHRHDTTHAPETYSRGKRTQD